MVIRKTAIIGVILCFVFSGCSKINVRNDNVSDILQFENASIEPTACLEINDITYQNKTYVFSGFINKPNELELLNAEEQNEFTNSVVNGVTKESMKVTAYRIKDNDLYLVLLFEDGYYMLYENKE